MAQHIFFSGPLGSGKSFAMSVFAHNWMHKTWMRGGDVKLFSNYGLKDSHEMLHYSDWYKVADAQGSICCWDEAQMAFDSRMSLKSTSIYASQLMMYTRKMKSIQMYASPSINNVDSRIRQVVEVHVHCRKIGDKGFSYMFTDYQTGQFMHKQFMPMYKARQLMRLNLYDTYNMVQGFPLPSTDREAKKFFEELESVHDTARRRNGRIVIA